MPGGRGARKPGGTNTLVPAARDEAFSVFRGAGSIRIVDFGLFFLLVTGIGVDVSFEATNVVMAAIAAYALTQRPSFNLGRFQWLVPLFAVMLTFATFVSLAADFSDGAADWKGRLLRMAVVAVLVFVTASGRVDLRSAVYGYCAALFVNVPLFYMGLLPDNYGGNLTGFVGDKNVAGLAYCLFGIMAISIASRMSHAVVLGAAFGSFVWLTGSRTSIAAFVAALAWILVARRLPLIARWLFGFAIAVLVDVTSEDYSRIGIFSDREGSDILRERIDDASLLKVRDTGFFGRGFGEAYVAIDDGTWFFHNSYWTALVEGGWPWAVFVVGVTVLVLLRPFTRSLNRQEVHAQALAIALLICATRLGEVFFTVFWAIPLAYAIQIQLAGIDGRSRGLELKSTYGGVVAHER